MAELFSDLRVGGAPSAAPHWRSHQRPDGFAAMSMERLQLIFCDAAAGQEGDGRRHHVKTSTVDSVMNGFKMNNII